MMNTNMTPELRAHVVKLNDERVRVAAEIKSALEAAGFTVSDIPAGTLTKKDITAQVTSTALPDWKQEFAVSPYTPRFSSNGIPQSNVANVGLPKGWRSRERRYPKLDGVAAKVVAFMQEALENAIASKAAATQAATEAAKAQTRRQAELGDLVVPPGMAVKHYTGLDAPAWYEFQVDKFGMFTSTKFTAEQVKRIAAVINAELGLNDLFVVSVSNRHGNRAYAAQAGFSMFVEKFDSAEPMSRAEAEAQAQAAIAEGYADVQVVSYRDAYLTAQKLPSM